MDNDKDKTFDEWWKELQGLAKDADWALGVKSSYKEFYDDGDSPEDALEEDYNLEREDDEDDDEK
jgi:hypothetical protein